MSNLKAWGWINADGGIEVDGNIRHVDIVTDPGHYRVEFESRINLPYAVLATVDTDGHSATVSTRNRNHVDIMTYDQNRNRTKAGFSFAVLAP